jgi:transposase
MLGNWASLMPNTIPEVSKKSSSYGERLRGCNVRNMNPEKAEGLSPELQAALQPLLAALESLSEQIAEYNERIEHLPQESYPQVALLKQIKGVGHADRSDLHADLGRPASLRQEPRRGLLSGTATRTEKLGTERAADAHQQGRRSLSAHLAGAGSPAHSGTVRRGL